MTLDELFALLRQRGWEVREAAVRLQQHWSDVVLRFDIQRLLAAGNQEDFDEGWPRHHTCSLCMDFRRN